MQKTSFVDWLKKLSVPRKFYVIAGSIVLILLFGFTSFWFGMKTMSAIRAYVGGEGLWSKAQKEAHNSLVAYTTSFNQADYDKFLSLLSVQAGDKQARLELEKKDPDFARATEGFLAGGNHPEDIDGMIFLFRTFRNVSYMDSAIATWTEADQEIEKLISTGEQIHQIISSHSEDESYASRSEKMQLLVPLVEELAAIDTRLTILENQFSSTLGGGSRYIKAVLLQIFAILTIMIGAFALFVATVIGKTITQVDKAKSEFVSLASHQLRTPLTAIAWGTERLLGHKVGTFDEKQIEYLQDIRHNNQRMILLVNSFLNVSRIELGTFMIEPSLVHLKTFIEDILKELSAQVIKKKLVIETLYQDETLRVRLDADLFRIVIQNLIGNAVHYTAPGGVVRVSVLSKKKGEVVGGKTMQTDTLVISIADTGCGIPIKEQRKIFAKLYRASNAKTKHTDGTGLGLYIAKAILDNASGTIWFTSKENHGTTFFVSVPLSGMRAKMNKKHLIPVTLNTEHRS